MQGLYGDVYLGQAREALRASLVAQMVKNLPAMQTQVWSLGQEDPLEKWMAIHSSILAWKIPNTEEPGGYSQRGHKELDVTEWLTLFLKVNILQEVGLLF